MNRLPFGPIFVSALVALLGTVYLFLADTGKERQRLQPGYSQGGKLRVASWNLNRVLEGLSEDDGEPIARVAQALTPLSPHIVALPFLQTEAQAQTLAEALGENWRCLTLPKSGESDGILAVLVHPSLTVKDRTLIEAGAAGDVLAITVEDEVHRVIKVLCVMVPNDDASRDPVNLSRLMAWCKDHPRGLTILAGGFNFVPGDLDALSNGSKNSQNHPRRQLLSRFTELAPAGACDPEDGGKHFDAVYVSAGAGRLIGGGIPDAAVFEGFPCRPIVADISLE